VPTKILRSEKLSEKVRKFKPSIFVGKVRKIIQLINWLVWLIINL
jgi:hypothetical protein